MLVLLLNKCSNRDTKDILNNILKFFLPLHESSLLQAKTWVTVTSSGTLVCFSISGPRSRTAPSAGPVWLAQSSCSHFVLDAMLLFMEPMVPLATLAASSVPLVSITRRLLEIWPWGDSVRGAGMLVLFSFSMHFSVRLLGNLCPRDYGRSHCSRPWRSGPKLHKVSVRPQETFGLEEWGQCQFTGKKVELNSCVSMVWEQFGAGIKREVGMDIYTAIWITDKRGPLLNTL